MDTLKNLMTLPLLLIFFIWTTPVYSQNWTQLDVAGMEELFSNSVQEGTWDGETYKIEWKTPKKRVMHWDGKHTQKVNYKKKKNQYCVKGRSYKCYTVFTDGNGNYRINNDADKPFTVSPAS